MSQTGVEGDEGGRGGGAEEFEVLQEVVSGAEVFKSGKCHFSVISAHFRVKKR
jgi:hypothetical protein